MRIPVRLKCARLERGGDERYCDDKRACSVTRVARGVAAATKNEKPADADIIGGYRRIPANTGEYRRREGARYLPFELMMASDTWAGVSA